MLYNLSNTEREDGETTNFFTYNCPSNNEGVILQSYGKKIPFPKK